MSLEEEEYVQSERMPITLVEYLPKKFLRHHSKNEIKEEVVQCCMVSVDDNEQEVNEVTLRSGRHFSLPQKEKLNQNATHDSSKEKIDNSSQPLGETKEAMKEDTGASTSKEEKREEESSIEIPV